MATDPSYPLRTERLDIRPFTAEDLDDAYAYRRLPEVTAYLYWGPRTREQVAEKLAEQARMCTLLDVDVPGLKLAVVWREKDTVVGEVDLRWVDREQRTAETGFVFNPAYAGMGLASEAATEMLRYAFEDAGLHRVIGRCDADNDASWRLMERIGMRREARFERNEITPYSADREDPWTSELVYAMLADEWAKRGA